MEQRDLAENSVDLDLHVVYGEELFTDVIGQVEVWNEICEYLERNKRERDAGGIYIPDFATSDEIYYALKQLRAREPKLFAKLISNDEKYVQLRNELFFGENNNIDKVMNNG